jgi:hypothetical protein
MPDPIVILTGMGVAFAVSAVLVAAFGWPRPKSGFSWVDAGWILGVAAGFFLGCWLLGNRPHWPLSEDQDRLFVLVLPAIVLVELLALSPRVPRWLVWPARAAVVVGTAPVLLHGSTYLSTEHGAAEWSPVQACAILGALAAVLATVWTLVTLLTFRAPGTIHAVCLATTSAGAAVTVMLSGYATGGQDGLPLAAALLGAATMTAAFGWSARGKLPLGVAIIGLYSLLVVGRFFGELSSTHGVLLFASPLLGWLPELHGLGRMPRWARNLCRVLLVGTLVSGDKAVAENSAAARPLVENLLPILDRGIPFGICSKLPNTRREATNPLGGRGSLCPQGGVFWGAGPLPPTVIRITISKCLNKFGDDP